MGILVCLAISLIAACGSDPVPTKGVEAAPAKTVLTVYSGRGESLVGGLFEQIPEDAPFEVEVQYGKTSEMVTRLLTEGAQSPADIIFAQDSGHLGVLADRGVLSTLPRLITDQVDARFQDSQGRWVGTSGRLRVLVYDSAKLGPAQLPQSLEELALPKWKGKLGWSPANGSLHAHVSALRHAWGEDKTRDWLRAVEANQPTRYPKNSPQVAAANDGAIELGWVNHYYLHRLKKEGRKAQNWSFPTPRDPGNVLMVSGVGIRQGSTKIKAAEAFVAWLVSDPVQTYFAQVGFEYPTRPGVSTHGDVPPVTADQLATVDQTHMADLGPTRTMLTELGLL